MMFYIKFNLPLLPSLIDCAPSIPSITTQFILSPLITLSFLTLLFLTLTIWTASYVLDLCPDLKYWVESSQTLLHSLRCLCTNLSAYNEYISIVMLLMFLFAPDCVWFFVIQFWPLDHWKSPECIKSGPFHTDSHST